MAKNKIGEASIEVSVDNAKLKQGVQEAKDEVKSIGTEADKTGGKVSGSFRKMGKGADGLAASLGKVVGILGAVVAAVAAVGKAWQAVNDYMRSGKKLAQEFASELDTVSDTSGSILKINERLLNVGLELEKKQRGGFGALGGRNKAQIQAELDELTKMQVSASRQRRQQIKTEDRKEREDANREMVKQIETINAESALSLLPDDAQIEIRAAVQATALKKAAIKAGVDVDDEALQRAIKNIEDIAMKEADEMRKLEAEKKRLELERIEEAAQKQIDASTRAADAFGERAGQALFGSSGAFTTRLDTILSEIQRVSQNQGRR